MDYFKDFKRTVKMAQDGKEYIFKDAGTRKRGKDVF